MPSPPSAPRKSPGRPPRISREEVVGSGPAHRRRGRCGATDHAAARRGGRQHAHGALPPRPQQGGVARPAPGRLRRTHLHRPELPDDPRERVVAAADAIHAALAACPWIVEVLTADDLMSASALWFVEQIVDGLVAGGLSPEQAVHGYRAIWYYTAGEIVVRATAARRRAADDRPTHRERVFGALDPGELPRLAQLADRWVAADRGGHPPGRAARAGGRPPRRPLRPPGAPAARGSAGRTLDLPGPGSPPHRARGQPTAQAGEAVRCRPPSRWSHSCWRQRAKKPVPPYADGPPGQVRSPRRPPRRGAGCRPRRRAATGSPPGRSPRRRRRRPGRGLTTWPRWRQSSSSGQS